MSVRSDRALHAIPLALAASLLCCAPSAARADNTGQEHPCLGVWQGMARNGGGLPWAIEMTVSSTDGACGGIEYDSRELDCGGRFTRCTFQAAAGRAVETYQHNVGCTPPGRVTFSCDGDVMEWDWVYDGPERVHTQLRRVHRITPATRGTGDTPVDGPTPTGTTDDGTPPTPTTPDSTHDVAPTPYPADEAPADDGRADEQPAERSDASEQASTGGCGGCGVADARQPAAPLALGLGLALAITAIGRGRRRRKRRPT